MLAQFTSRMKNIRIQSADVFREPIEATYGQASVLVHPAIEDGFALAVAQALACGRPVITTRNTGAAEVIADGVNGYVLESRDVDGLVDRLRLLARDRSLLERLSAAAPAGSGPARLSPIRHQHGRDVFPGPELILANADANAQTNFAAGCL